MKGVEVIVEPYTIGGWKDAIAKDPNGIWIEFTERKIEHIFSTGSGNGN